jgi:hypothetical protein
MGGISLFVLFFFLVLVLFLIENDPVVLVVVLVALLVEQVLEHVLEQSVVGLLLELQVAGEGQVLREFVGVALAEDFNRGRQFFFLDAFVLVLLGCGLEGLPGEHAPEEVHGHVADALEVVPAGLLDAEVRVDGGVAGGAGEVLALAVGDVLAVLLDVALGEPEVDQEDLVGGLVEAHAEVVGLDVAVDEVAGVDVLDAVDHLLDEDEHGLEAELAQGLVEEGLEARAHEVHDQDVVVALGRAVVDVRDALVDHRHVVVQVEVQLALVDQLRVVRVHRLDLHRHVHVALRVYRLVDLRERSLVDLLYQLEVLAHLLHNRHN